MTDAQMAAVIKAAPKLQTAANTAKKNGKVGEYKPQKGTPIPADKITVGTFDVLAGTPSIATYNDVVTQQIKYKGQLTGQ